MELRHGAAGASDGGPAQATWRRRQFTGTGVHDDRIMRAQQQTASDERDLRARHRQRQRIDRAVQCRRALC
jgi:hypothetical protein